MGLLNFLTSIICFFLLLFSVNLFFAKRGSRVLNYLLGVIFFSRFGQLLVLLLANSKQHALFPFFHQLFTPLYFAAPACFYLYVSHFINPHEKLRNREWLHFIPAALAIIHIIPWPFSPAINWHNIFKHITDNKQLFITESSGVLPAYYYYIGRPVLMLGYLAATWYNVLSSEVLKEKQKEDIGKVWILLFVKAATFFQLVGFLPLLATNPNRTYSNSIFLMVGCVVLLIIFVFIIHQPNIFYRYLVTPIGGMKAESQEKSKVKAGGVNTGSSKKVILSPEQSATYATQMESLMADKKLYLVSDFQIVDLAGELNISVHHCSFVINNVIDKNFRDWINGYRVNHFMIQYPLHAQKMTIEAIANESGFKSLSTFYNAFKKETGLMPKAYFPKCKAL